MFGNKKRIKELEKKIYELEDSFRANLKHQSDKIGWALKKHFEATNKPEYKCGQKIWAKIYHYGYQLKQVTVIKSYADFSCDNSLSLMYKVIDESNCEHTTHPVNMFKTKPKDKCKC